MIAILVAAILIALGILAVFLSAESGKKDERLLVVMLVGEISIVAGIWLIISTIGIFTIIKKIAGLLLLVFGGFMILKFPDIDVYQPKGYTITGIFIGIICAVIGVYLLLF
jgi:hypothetical protein